MKRYFLSLPQPGKKALFLFLLLLSCTAPSWATHMAGAEIEYTCIGPRKWSIKLIVYRLCDYGAATLCSSFSCSQSMTATPSPTIAAGGLNPNGCTANPSSVPFTLQLTKVEDVGKGNVARCGQSAKNGCTNLGSVSAGPYRPSIERYIFEGVLDMSASVFNAANTCPYWDIGWSYCCRNSTENVVGQPSIYAHALVNIFATGVTCFNSSPVFKNEAVQLFCAGREMVFNMGAVDPDGDSLSYRIVKALQAANTPVNYSAPYSEKYPFPLVSTLPPHSNYPGTPFVVLDSINGDLSLNALNTRTTPIGGNFCVQVLQWRYKEQPVGSGIRVPYLVGTTTRDLDFFSIPCPGNNPPRFATTPALANGSPKYNWSVCAGEQLCFSITAKDTDYKPTQVPPLIDSTWLSWDHAIERPAGKVHFAPDYDTAAIPSQRPREDRWRFCWQTELEDTSTLPYYFTVRGEDNRCPSIGHVTRAFSVTVSQGPQADLLKTALSCNRWSLKVRKTNGSQPLSMARLEVAKAPFDYTFSAGSTLINSPNPNPAGTGNGPRIIIEDSVLFTRPGKYLVKYVLATTGNSSCSSTYTDTIEVTGELPEAVLADTFKCKHTNLLLDPQTMGGVAPYQYKWYKNSVSGNPINPAPYQTGQLLVTDTQTTSYILVLSDTSGCFVQQPVTVQVKKLGTNPILVNSSQQCITGNSFTFSHNPVSSFINYTNTWLYDNQSSTDSTLLVSFANVDTHTVKLVISEAGGCSDTASRQVVVVGKPDIRGVIGVNDSLQCLQGNLFVYSRTALPGHSYKWIYPGGSSSNPGWSTVYPTSGQKTIQLEVKQNNGCTDTASRTVTVTSKPSAGQIFVTDTFQCITGNLFTFDHPVQDSLTYKWVFENQSSTNAVLHTSFTTPGIKTVKLVATEYGGCTDTAFQKVTVLARPVTTNLIQVNDSIQCITGNHFQYAYYLVNNRQIFTHTWLNNGVSSSDLLLDVIYPTVGAKQIKLVVSQEGGCSDTVSRNVSVTAKPKLTGVITVNDSIQCIDSNSFAFNYTSANDPLLFRHTWLHNGVLSTAPQLNTSYSTTGLKEIKLILAQEHGCRDTASVQVYVAPVPDVQGVIGINDSVQCQQGNSFVFTYQRPPNTQDAFSWIIAGAAANGTPLVHSFTTSGEKEISLIVTNNFGCSDTAMQIVRVKPSPASSAIQGPSTGLVVQSEYEYRVTPQPFHAYKWSVTNGLFTAGDSTDVVRVKWTSIGAASLSVKQTEDGCEAYDSAFYTIGSVGLKEQASLGSLRIMPNPNSGVFRIELESEHPQEVQVTLHNILGALVWSHTPRLSGGANQLDVQVDVPDGLYLLTIYNNDNKLVNRMLISR